MGCVNCHDKDKTKDKMSVFLSLLRSAVPSGNGYVQSAPIFAPIRCSVRIRAHAVPDEQPGPLVLRTVLILALLAALALTLAVRSFRKSLR